MKEPSVAYHIRCNNRPCFSTFTLPQTKLFLLKYLTVIEKKKKDKNAMKSEFEQYGGNKIEEIKLIIGGEQKNY